MALGERMAGRTVIVTGGASGIGAAISRRFAEEGAAVAIFDIDLVAAETLASEMGDSSFAVEVDISDPDSVEIGVARVLEKQSGLDVLVNNAGIAGPQFAALGTSIEGWRQTIGVNLTGCFLMSKAALPALIESRGSIVNIASALAVVGWRDECAYGPSKAGVVQLTKGMALDYARHVRVNCVCPGAVRTTMIEATVPPGADLEAAMAEYGKIHPLHQRLAQPEEIADAVLFLASDDASLITGVSLMVDAGFTAR